MHIRHDEHSSEKGKPRSCSSYISYSRFLNDGSGARRIRGGEKPFFLVFLAQTFSLNSIYTHAFSCLVTNLKLIISTTDIWVSKNTLFLESSSSEWLELKHMVSIWLLSSPIFDQLQNPIHSKYFHDLIILITLSITIQLQAIITS